MAEIIKFETGIEEFNLNGQKTVYFCPTDMNFIETVFRVVETLDQKELVFQKELEALGEDEEAKVFDLGKAHDQEIREEINGIFGDDICTPVFGTLNVFALADGLPVWANLLFAIIDKLDDKFVAEKEKTNPRLAKYTAKYSKRRKK